MSNPKNKKILDKINKDKLHNSKNMEKLSSITHINSKDSFNNSTFKHVMRVQVLVSLGLLSSISILLSAIIRFPLIPAAPFLEYDPSDIPILLGTFIFGIVPGIILSFVSAVVRGLVFSSSSGIIGIIMNFLASSTCLICSGVIFNRKRTLKSAIIGLSFGVIGQSVIMIIMNLFFMPIFLSTPLDTVLPMILPIILPFNLIKASINCVVTFFVYKSISPVFKFKI